MTIESSSVQEHKPPFIKIQVRYLQDILTRKYTLDAHYSEQEVQEIHDATETCLKTSRAPVHELDCALGFDSSNSSIDILGDNIPTVQHTAGHVLAMARVTLHHLIGWLKARVGDLGHRELLVIGFLC